MLGVKHAIAVVICKCPVKWREKRLEYGIRVPRIYIVVCNY